MYAKNMKGIFTIIVTTIVVFVLALIGCFSTYNSLIDLQEDVNHAQANVQTMMQRRLELIPDLVETTKAASEHEEKVYENIVNAREALNTSIKSGNTIAMDEANKQLTTAIDNYLKIIVRDYPEIATSEQYTSLMDQLEGSVNRITIARENYNDVVSEYNKKIKKYPANLFANTWGFQEIEPFVADEEAINHSMVNFD